METEFKNAISLQIERDRDCRRRILSTYRDMIRHYREEGLGERSKYAGCIIKQNMIYSVRRKIRGCLSLGRCQENVRCVKIIK